MWGIYVHNWDMSALVEILRPYNQRKLAGEMKVSHKRVNAWANGRAVPKIMELPRLADILRMDLAALTELAAQAEAEMQAARSAA